MPHRNTLQKNPALNNINQQIFERATLLERSKSDHYIDPAIIPYRRLNAEVYQESEPLNKKQRLLLAFILGVSLAFWFEVLVWMVG